MSINRSYIVLPLGGVGDGHKRCHITNNDHAIYIYFFFLNENVRYFFIIFYFLFLLKTLIVGILGFFSVCREGLR